MQTVCESRRRYLRDGRESRYIREVLDWLREQDARDLERDGLNGLIENMTALSGLEKSEKSWRSWQREEFV